MIARLTVDIELEDIVIPAGTEFEADEWSDCQRIDGRLICLELDEYEILEGDRDAD